MTEAIGALLAFLALLVAWKCWKKTARATVRDRLFVLRDELRNHYTANGLDMTDGVYKKTRTFLNRLIRYTKSMRMIGYLYFASHVDRATLKATDEDFEASLQNCDVATERLIRRIRRQACASVFLYMGATSIGFLSAGVIIGISLLPAKSIVAIKRCLNSLIEVRPATLECAAME